MGTESTESMASLKYTVDKYGADWYKEEVEKDAALTLEEPRPALLLKAKDYYGWRKSEDGKWYLLYLMKMAE